MKTSVSIAILFLALCISAFSQGWEPEYHWKKGMKMKLTIAAIPVQGQDSRDVMYLRIDSVDQQGNAYIHISSDEKETVGFGELQEIHAGSEARPLAMGVVQVSILNGGIFQIVVNKYGEYLRGTSLKDSETRKRQLANRDQLDSSMIWSVDKECRVIHENVIYALPKHGQLKANTGVYDTLVESRINHGMNLSTGEALTTDTVFQVTSLSHTLQPIDAQSTNYDIVRVQTISTTKNLKLPSKDPSLRYTMHWTLRKSDGILLNNECNVSSIVHGTERPAMKFSYHVDVIDEGGK